MQLIISGFLLGIPIKKNNWELRNLLKKMLKNIGWWKHVEYKILLFFPHYFGYCWLNIMSNLRNLPRFVVNIFSPQQLDQAPQEQLIRLALVQYMEQAVLEIDRTKKTVTLEDGRSIKYSKLVVADAWPGYITDSGENWSSCFGVSKRMGDTPKWKGHWVGKMGRGNTWGNLLVLAKKETPVKDYTSALVTRGVQRWFFLFVYPSANFHIWKIHPLQIMWGFTSDFRSNSRPAFGRTMSWRPWILRCCHWLPALNSRPTMLHLKAPKNPFWRSLYRYDGWWGYVSIILLPPFLPFRFQNHIISLHSIWEDMVSYNVGMQDMQKKPRVFSWLKRGFGQQNSE